MYRHRAQGPVNTCYSVALLLMHMLLAAASLSMAHAYGSAKNQRQNDVTGADVCVPHWLPYRREGRFAYMLAGWQTFGTR